MLNTSHGPYTRSLKPRLRDAFLALALTGVIGAGCVVEAGPGPVSACGELGSACCTGRTCSVGLTCTASGLCASVAPGPVCGASGQVCCAGNVCGAGLLCGVGNVCTAGVARGAYEACTAGEACASGTTCTAAMYSSTGQPGTLCSFACTRGEQCPVSLFGSAYLPTCVVSASAGTGLCYDTCVSNADCGGGTTCAMIPGTAARICVPVGAPAPACGAVGQACCGGTGCSAGLVCSAGACTRPVTSNRNAYDKCSAADVCVAGTQCLPSIAQVAGKSRGTACTVGCAAGSTVCPGYVPGAATQSVACVNLTGTLAEAQCFRLCATQNDCVTHNTTCTQFNVSDGSSVRVCVPSGPRP